YTRRSKTSTLIVGVYEDDLIITGTLRKEIDAFKSKMKDKFEMSNIGLLAYYLGIEVTQAGGEITIKQTGYINKILKETSMADSNDTKIPMDPDTKLVKAKDGNPVDATYCRSLIGSLRITGYSDSSYEINTDQGKGTTCIVFHFGESPITWCTQKQPIVALSSCESKFMAATGAACQALWLKRLLSELTGWKEEKITLKIDNISAIALEEATIDIKEENVNKEYRFFASYKLWDNSAASDHPIDPSQQIEMEMRMKLRMLRIDRGVERRNRTVLSTMRSMMKAMKLPLTFWVEVVRYAIYILNRVPTRTLIDKTLYEALYNRKPNLENLRIFGCIAYAKITIPHLKKLDDRSIPLIYLGVEEGSKACRLYDPLAKKKHVSRDVKFMETKLWDWNKDGEDTSKQDTFRASFVVEGVDTKNTTPVNTEINDNINDTYQEPDPINDPNSAITPPTYTYNP
nr:zinc finger, CCHC-type [Tanacetum cinerariifolium]